MCSDEDGTFNPGISGGCSNQLSYLARARRLFIRAMHCLASLDCPKCRFFPSADFRILSHADSWTQNGTLDYIFCVTCSLLFKKKLSMKCLTQYLALHILSTLAHLMNVVPLYLPLDFSIRDLVDHVSVPSFFI